MKFFETLRDPVENGRQSKLFNLHSEISLRKKYMGCRENTARSGGRDADVFVAFSGKKQ